MSPAPIFKDYTDPAYRELLAMFSAAGRGLPVIANGVMDLLHPGHLSVIAAACSAAEGRAPVIVALNTDESVLKCKKHYPYFTFEHRAAVLAVHRGIDAVVGFSEETPEALLKDYPYSVLVRAVITAAVVSWVSISSVASSFR